MKQQKRERREWEEREVALEGRCENWREAAKRRGVQQSVTESIRVPPRVPYRSHTSINSLWPH